jgi:hypothetical protein
MSGIFERVILLGFDENESEKENNVIEKSSFHSCKVILSMFLCVSMQRLRSGLVT